MTWLFFSGPAITLSIEFSISTLPIVFLFFLAAKSAASFNKFARSAPVNPGVCLASTSKFTFLAKGLSLE